MTGFDETVPPDDDPDRDENAAGTQVAPTDEPTRDEPPAVDAAEEQAPTSEGEPFGGDDDIASGHYGPDAS